jgi:hypothetical protein
VGRYDAGPAAVAIVGAHLGKGSGQELVTLDRGVIDLDDPKATLQQLDDRVPGVPAGCAGEAVFVPSGPDAKKTTGYVTALVNDPDRGAADLVVGRRGLHRGPGSPRPPPARGPLVLHGNPGTRPGRRVVDRDPTTS